MYFAQALNKNLIQLNLEFSSKKRALELLSAKIAEEYPILHPIYLFEALMARERLGNTSISRGIAIPHCRATGITHCIAGLFRLTTPIFFDAIDHKLVDLMIVLIIPEQETKRHLEILANIAECFNNDEFCTKIRTAETADNIHQLIVGYGR